jgi:CDP-paratose 2-epimerase
LENKIKIINGDIRFLKDMSRVPSFDFLIDCAADPSALSGVKNGLSYLVETNVNGTLNCLNLVKKNKAKIIFLSSSRVYSHVEINNLKYRIDNKELIPKKSCTGLDLKKGISENFDTQGLKTFYGFTKLGAENLIKEYSNIFGIDFIINRSGVISGPWQWGRVDQGFMAYWVMAYMFKRKLKYIGYGGKGYQVRDILNIQDFCRLIEMQITNFNKFKNDTFNIGGGKFSKISLIKLTEKCKEIFNTSIEPSSSKEERPGDIPYYVSDYSKIQKLSGWEPEINVEKTIEDIDSWVKKNNSKLVKLI